jgi:Leucine-rich repeat (LRR) protein
LINNYPELENIEELSEIATDFGNCLENRSGKTIAVNLSGYKPITINFNVFSDHLVALSMTHSSIAEMPELPLMQALNTLDLSFNCITTIKLKKSNLPNLKHLDLAGNNISDVLEICKLSEIETLESIDLRFNAISRTKNLRSLTILSTKRINSINLVKVGAEELKKVKSTLDSWEIMMAKMSTDQVQSCRPLSIRTYNGPASSALERNFYLSKVVLDNPFVPDIITTLELDSCYLVSLDSLPSK